MEERIGRMSLRQKIGQMLLCGFHGTEMSGELERFIKEHQIGGVIYFARNVESAAQVAKLSAELQRAAAEADSIPLWVSIDQEGGMVARITEGVALTPGNMAIAAAGSRDAAELLAFISGQELKALGVNLNYAPVLDVNNNPLNPVIGVRSYGESPELAAEYGARAIRGLQNAGVAATAKHFPGHGDTSVDSHLDLPTVLHDRERMERIELVPFKRAIAEGVDAIMSAHIRFPALEPEGLPATLSRTVLKGLLREELGFEGVITTDCMEMNAIASHYGTVEAAVMAVEAGADVVLISHRADLQAGALDAIERAVRDGRLSEARIEQSVKRLLALKAKRGVLAGGGLLPQEPLEAVLARPAHLEAARKVSEDSVTLVRDEAGTLPLKRERTLAITVAAAVMTQVDETFGGGQSLGAALAAGGLDVIDRVVSLKSVEAETAALVAAAEAADVKQIVFGTYNAHFHPAQVELARKLQQLGKPLAAVGLRNPYDLLALPDDAAFVAVYESRPLALQSAAKALLGLIPFRGRLPVSLGERYPAGWGVQRP
ncbi:beta-glucosidase [Paenibacillus beijingensis]|uniref:beta-N-acetylhexosaminidase n=1 Tax=Paenibacillus beijingensis TaxID=1126833 RepID=A0A0D5NR51_9BACL|nr:beta-glucosidase [Paenibacillus beijingensis]